MCAEYGKPEGVIFSFHVCSYSIEPTELNRSLNLFANDALKRFDAEFFCAADEFKPDGPEVAFVVESFLLARAREGLTRAGAGDDWEIVGHAGKSERVTPSADAAEKVVLGVSDEIAGLDFADASLVHHPGGNMSICDELTQPRRSFLVILIVKIHNSKPSRRRWWLAVRVRLRRLPD